MPHKYKNAIRVIRTYKFKQATKQFFADIDTITGGFYD